MLRDQLSELLGPVVAGLGYELWELEFAPRAGGGLLRLYIDSADGITLDDCERVSRAVSDKLDEEDPIAGRYTLEVSTRGAAAPLTARRHYARAIGRLVVLTLEDGGTLAGRLVDVERDGGDGEAVVVTPVTPGVKGRPAKVGDPVRVPLARVRTGRVEVELVKDGGREQGDGAGDGATDGPTGRED